MSQEITRRNLMMLAGAGVATSACGPLARRSEKDEGVVKPERLTDLRSPFVLLTSGCQLYGENPHDDPPSSATGTPYRYPAFAPDYVTILYLGLEAGWNIRVNHASYHLPGASEGDRLNKVRKVLEDVVPRNRRFRDFAQAHGTYRRRDNTFDGDSFRTFGFKSPNELFIYLHNPTIKLDTFPLISFGEYGQDGTPRERNYSFFNAHEASAGATLDAAGKLIRMRNYVKNVRASDITVANQGYAMNVHFTVAAGAAGRIAMIIDPDTGNGTGNEP